MSTVTLHLPLFLSEGYSFIKTPEMGELTLFGFRADLTSDSLQTYLEFKNVPTTDAPSALERFRRAVLWAAIRLDFGIKTDAAMLQNAELGTFNGSFSTAIPSAIKASPISSHGTSENIEPASRLFKVLTEADEKTSLSNEPKDSTLLLACELFGHAHFEGTADAKFLILMMSFEVLAKPIPRLPASAALVEKLISDAKKIHATADAATKDALRSLWQSAKFLKQESIRSSIRKRATAASTKLGDANPDEVGRLAAQLYDKRSDLVHNGRHVSWRDVATLQKLAREALAVESDCYHNVREHFVG